MIIICNPPIRVRIHFGDLNRLRRPATDEDFMNLDQRIEKAATMYRHSRMHPAVSRNEAPDVVQRSIPGTEWSKAWFLGHEATWPSGSTHQFNQFFSNAPVQPVL